MSEDLQLQSYEPQFLTLEDMGKEDVFLPADAEEEEILLKLRKRLLEQREEEADEGGADAELAATGDDVAAVRAYPGEAGTLRSQVLTRTRAWLKQS